MTREDDFIDQLEGYLDEYEGTTPLPDAVRHAVRVQLSTNRQIGPVSGLMRDLIMDNNVIRIGLVAAAVVVIAVIAFNLLPGSPAPGGAPSATPEPSVAEPSVAPSAAAGLPVDSSYTLSEDPLPISVTIPAPGWTAEDVAWLVKDGNCCAPDGASILGTWAGEPLVPSDPCNWASTMPDTPATTLEEIGAALAGQATRDASEPMDVTVDGHPGTSVTLHVPADIAYDGNEFTDCDEGKFCTLSFEDGAECYMWYHGPDEFSDVWIVDLDGQFVIVTGNYAPETPAEDVDEVRAILGSMTFSQ